MERKEWAGLLQRGVWKGLSTTWVLAKVIVPITIVVTLLKHTPVIDWIVWLCAPLMHLVGLSGEAAMVLALGWVMNIYAAIGGIVSLDLNGGEIFILSVMLSFCHNLFVETVVARRIGLNAAIVVGLRMGVAFLSAFALHHLLGIEGSGAAGAVGTGVERLPYLWEQSLFTTGQEVLLTAWKAVWQLALIVIPLMFVIQILKELRVLDKIAHLMTPVLRLLGLPNHAAIPLLAGIWFGLAYGAGVIIEATQEKPMSKRELYLIMLFLILSHAVVEDTVLFLPVGVNAMYLLGIRLLMAVVLTALVARMWRRRSTHESNESHTELLG
ncbi:MAG TPA: nucleoside recognition domain-containing protein [Bacilli bacterium]|nr:nucleoside recognition domain-containing protein [Bacilli bacterium]